MTAEQPDNVALELPAEPQREPERHCGHCGMPITASRGTSRFCSGKCERSALRRRSRARRPSVPVYPDVEGRR